MKTKRPVSSPPPFAVGQRVRPSGYVLREKRDHWLAAGRSEDKSRAKEWLDRATAERGTVLACEPGKFTAWIVTVRTDSEATHNSLPHLWEVVEANG